MDGLQAFVFVEQGIRKTGNHGMMVDAEDNSRMFPLTSEYKILVVII